MTAVRVGDERPGALLGRLRPATLPEFDIMSATVEARGPRDATGPVPPSRVGFLSKVPEGFAAFFGALSLLCVLLAFFAPAPVCCTPSLPSSTC